MREIGFFLDLIIVRAYRKVNTTIDEHIKYNNIITLIIQMLQS